MFGLTVDFVYSVILSSCVNGPIKIQVSIQYSYHFRQTSAKIVSNPVRFLSEKDGRKTSSNFTEGGNWWLRRKQRIWTLSIPCTHSVKKSKCDCPMHQFSHLTFWIITIALCPYLYLFKWFFSTFNCLLGSFKTIESCYFAANFEKKKHHRRILLLAFYTTNLKLVLQTCICTKYLQGSIPQHC